MAKPTFGRVRPPAPETVLQRVTSAQPSATAPVEFIVTQEYLRFAEFCDACREARYIGLCYCVPGVGKTVWARQYAHWDELESILGPPPHRFGTVPRPDSGPWRTVFYTPGVVNTPRTVEHAVGNLWGRSTAWVHDPPGTPIQTQPSCANRPICSSSTKPTV